MRRYMDFIHSLFEDYDTGRFLERMNGVMELVRRGSTEGERNAARQAFERMMARARDEIIRMREPNSGVTSAEISRFMQALQRVSDGFNEPKAKAEPKKAVPKFEVGQWVIHTVDASVGKIVRVIADRNGGIYYTIDSNGEKTLAEEHLRRATQSEVDAALARRNHRRSVTIDLLAMARYVNPGEKSNKVYGIIEKAGAIYTFWGGWQKALKIKQYPSEMDAREQFNLKLRKGYREIYPDTEIEAWVTRSLDAEFARN